MKIAKYFRNYTFVLIISVLLLSLMTMKVAYSAIFAVASTPNLQEINTGTLNVIVDNNISRGIPFNELFPSSSSGTNAMSELPTSSSVIPSGDNYAVLNIINTGTLDSDFNVSISYQDPEDIPSQYSGRRPVSMDYLLVGVYTEGGWIQYGSSYYTQIGNIVPNADGEYPIISDSIAAPTGSNTKVSKTYYVYIWLREDTPATEIGKLAYLKLNVKSIASDQS